MKKELEILIESDKVTRINGIAIEGDRDYIDSLIDILKDINGYMELLRSEILLYNDRLYTVYLNNKNDLVKYRKICGMIKEEIKYQVELKIGGIDRDTLLYIVVYTITDLTKLIENKISEYLRKKNVKDTNEVVCVVPNKDDAEWVDNDGNPVYYSDPFGIRLFRYEVFIKKIS